VSGAHLELADIVKTYGITESAARRRARQDGWRRTATRPKMYRLADAQASYDRRRVPGARVRQHLIRTYCQPAA